MTETCRIPLIARDGSVRAYALVDPEDFEEQGQYRWCLHGLGYAHRNSGRVQGQSRHVLLHREIMGLKVGDGLEVDHRNRNRLDCRRSNMRVVTRGQNAQNVPAQFAKYRGVSWCAVMGAWRARCQHDGREHLAGYFDTEEEANEAAIALRRRVLPYSEEEAA